MLVRRNKEVAKMLKRMGAHWAPFHLIDEAEYKEELHHARIQHSDEEDVTLEARAKARVIYRSHFPWRKVYFAIGIGLVLLFASSRAHAQVDCVKWQASDGSTVGNYCSPFKVKAGSNVTFSKSGTTITLDVSTAGIAGRPYVDVKADCGAVGDGATDDGATINTCLINNAGKTVFFPKTQAATSCDFFSTVTLVPYGTIEGGGSIWTDGASLKGTNICFPSGVTGINYQLVQSRGSVSIRNIGLLGGDYFGDLTSPTKFIIPKASSLTMFDRTISSIQRASNVLTVTVNAINGVGEKLFQQVGSTVNVNGVVGDSTMNGLCIISGLSGGSFANDNYSTFTCPQNGSDSGPYTSDGKVSLPTTGNQTSDGVRVCGNFYVFDHLSIQGFARWGINADANSGEGCDNLFADDLTVRESTLTNNQVGGFFTRGTDSSVDLFIGNSFYYNGGYAVWDDSALGNTYVNNNISNNGSQWAGSSIPATKNISTISRTSSTVSVALASADTNIKVGSCVVIAGVTDTSFSNTSGQCYFVTVLTDSTHYQYIQPGAPANASSSGGTSRIGTFGETYLSSGMDSGGSRMGLGASASADHLVLNNYTEGGQPNKFGSEVLVIQGANGGGTGSFTGSYISTQTFQTGSLGSNLTHLGNRTEKTSGYELFFHAGLTSDKHEYLTWANHSGTRMWWLDVDTSSPGSITWCRGACTARRMIWTGSGSTRFNSEGATAVEFNKDASSGTGGVDICDGAASPVCLNLNSATASTVGAAGGASALPATPTGYLIIKIGATTFKLPYYAN